MSVIITSYNEIEYLPEAIESCLSQTFQDFEIIIGDDGSNDGSLELIKNYCEKYPGKINYFVMERNVKKEDVIPAARHSNVIKNALGKTKGKYIVVLDGDDYFCNDEKFSDAVNFLNSHNKYVAYASSFKMVFPAGNEAIINSPYSREYPGFIFWAGMYIHLSNFIFRRSVWDEGYFLDHSYSDTSSIFAILCAGRVRFVESVTFAYRQRKGSDRDTASKLGLDLLELMLFQECLCKGRMKWSSYSRYYNPLKYVYEHRDELSNPAYEKYFKRCEPYDNNILVELAKCDTSLRSKLFIKFLLLKGKIAKFIIFHYVIRIYHIPGKLRRIFKKITRS